MKKGQIINGYRMLRDFTNAGGGMSTWTFAEKGGEEFFFKEFLAPTFPTEDAPGSAKTKEQKRKRCAAFETHQNSVVAALKSKCARGGNVIFARDFFRSGTKYYKVTDKVDVASLQVEDIARLPMESRVLIMKTVAHSLDVLHKCDIVHGDLKPNNLLIKRSTHGEDTYIAKLIDFDASYFAGKPPELAEDLVGDLVFYSPEAARYVREDSAVSPSALGLASDVFALGVIYCLYLTGELPAFDQKTYQYPCIAAINGEPIRIRPGAISPALSEIINHMLQTEASARPSVRQVFERLKTLDRLVSHPVPTSSASGESRLRGSLLKKTGISPVATSSKESGDDAAPSPTAKAVEGETSRLRGKLIKPKSS